VNKLILKSPAKINLYLAILNKRKDGYHGIKSVFSRISLHDDVVLKLRADSRIRILTSHKWFPKDFKKNLAYRSAKLLQDTCGVKIGVDISIVKRIPIGAGLGGGSSNAATVLMGLNKLWKLGLSKDKLAQLGSKIGSDVPFFIWDCRFALVKGRGEKVKPLKSLSREKINHILVVPDIKVPTPRIYQEWDKGKYLHHSKLTIGKYNDKILSLGLKKKDPLLLNQFIFNDLEKVTLKLYPAVRRIKDKLRGLGIKAILMSGSGPAVYGIVSLKKEALVLSRQLKKQAKNWRIFVAQTR